MIQLFIHQDTLATLCSTEFSSQNDDRKSFIVDFIEEPVRVKLLARTDHYYVTDWIRDDRNEDVLTTDESLIFPFDEQPQAPSRLHKFAFIIRQAEIFLGSINFWDTYNVPNPKNGGILIFAQDGNLDAKVVTGNERPLLACYSLEHLYQGTNKLIMARPYNWL